MTCAVALLSGLVHPANASGSVEEGAVEEEIVELQQKLHPPEAEGSDTAQLDANGVPEDLYLDQAEDAVEP